MAPAKGVSASATSLAHSMMMPRCTMSITRTKGLLNMPGQNNCFLNSAVQVLWHLDIFRRSFRDLSGHICMSDSCIFCALKELFAQFQYSQESALPPDALRRALAETFFDQRRFQLGYMDDAAECFENILQRIHFHIASQEVEDMCNVAHCIPHQKFAMTLVEQTVCHVCGASSEPLPFTQMVHYVSASALCLQASLVDSKEQKPVSFGELLRRAGGMGDIRDCPSSCGAKIQICKTLMNRPDIVSLGLVWDSERPSVDHIVDVLDSIGMTVNMDEMFHKVVDTRWASTVTHHLVGIVTYYGKHYSTFFFHTKLCVWIYFDDATVREIGPHWQQVVDKCHRGHFQPLLLLYANPNGTPVSTATAPTSVIHYISEHKKKQMDLKRSTSEKHRYGQQNGKNSEQLPAGMHIASDASWSRGSYLTNKKGISIGGRSAVQEPLPISDMAFAHCAKPRARTYSDTSIMSERPYEQHGSGSDLETQHVHTIEGARHVARQAGRDNTSDIDINGTYISRQAVESVLSLQHKQRQRTLHGANTPVVPGSRNSSSSLESFENSLHMREKASDCVDGACRRRDSGNWSGDRNSASSASSTSLDGSYYCASGVRRACGSPGRPVNNFSKHEYSNIGMLVDKGYDSYSLSSTDSYPSAGMPGSPAKADPRLQQIPEAVHISNRLERAIHHSLLQGSDSASDSVFDDVFTSGKGEEEESQDCDKLCSQAEMCLKMSYEKEQAGDLKMAIFFSDSAAAKARAAMDAPYGNAQSLIAAKMKHSMSVMRSSNLSKRLKEAEERRRGKESNGYDAHHSRQGSRDSTHSRHTRQGSRDSACTVIDLSEPVKSIEIYATLPKKSSKKKSALFAQSSLRLKDGVENYKDFLAEQWHTSSQDDMAIKMMSDGEYTLNPKTKMRNGVGSHGETNGTKMKDPEFSDYSSEWEQSKKPSLHRTLSNPTGMKNHDAEDGGNASASMKKQHRIRRKLMGGFMRRKNRSLPDLREGKDAPQAESRALDDTVIFDAKNECGIKQESSNEDEAREDHSATIKRRGFHQPHRAFVSRNYAQRPLLTKVDPPQVDGVTSSASLHQKNTACGQQDDSSKQTPCWPQPRQQPSEGVITSTMLHHRNTAFEQQDLSAIQVPCWPQTRQKPPEKLGNKTVGVDIGGFSDSHMPNTAVNLPNGFNLNQGMALEPNSFLTELHIKRTQILKSLPKPTENVRKHQGGEPATPVKLEQHSSSAPSGNNWLCELQSKQMAMLKKGDHVDDVKTTRDKDTIPSGKDEAVRQPLMYCATQVANRNEYLAESQATQYPNGLIQSSDEQHNESAEEQEDIKPKSVKDLALRFEKILRPTLPDQEVSIVREELQLSAVKEPSFTANKGAPGSAGNLVTPRDSSCESQAMSVSSLAMRSERTSASASLQTGSENMCQGRPFGTSQFTQSAAAPCHRTANSASHSQQMTPAGQTCQPQNLAKSLCSSGSLTPLHQAPISPPAPCPINSVRHHASFTRPLVPQTSFQSTSPVIGTINGTSNHLAPSHGDSVLVASSIGVSSHGASSSGGGSYGTASYEQKPRPPSAQQLYGKAFPNVKYDLAETRFFSMVRGHPAIPVVGETTLHTTSPANNDSSKRPTRPPDYETALQRLEMIKEQHRTTSPDTCQFPAKTPPDVLQGQQLPQSEVELGKMRKTALKKCVTFSDEVVLVACAEEEEDDYVPNPLLERVYRQHAAKQDCSRECHETSQFEDISSVHSSDSCDSVCHVDSVVRPHDSSQVPCNLCHKKFVSPPTVYCPDCAFYMSRFQKRT